MMQCLLHHPSGAAIFVACLIMVRIFVRSIVVIGFFILYGECTVGTAASILAVPPKLGMGVGKRSSADGIL